MDELYHKRPLLKTNRQTHEADKPTSILTVHTQPENRAPQQRPAPALRFRKTVKLDGQAQPSPGSLVIPHALLPPVSVSVEGQPSDLASRVRQADETT